MRHILVHNLFIPIDAEVVALRYEVGLGHAEALPGTRALELAAFAFSPSGKDVGQVVPGMLLGVIEAFQTDRRDLFHSQQLSGLHSSMPSDNRG